MEDGSSGVYKLHEKYVNTPVSATRNGYLYIYVSNESDQNVFFDNLQFTHQHGPILEETHYYSLGLIMAGISNQASGALDNKMKFNGMEHMKDLDFNQYDAFFRTLDPQTGRWHTIDPRPNVFESPYAAMGNNPVLRADPLGDTAIYDNVAGKEIYRLADGSKRITPTIVSDRNRSSFKEAIKDGATVKELAGLGTTYDTKAFSKFFADYGKKFKANYIGSTKIGGDDQVKVNGKMVGKNSLKAEAVGNVVLKGGVVTVGTNAATTNNSMTGADPDKPGNEPGRVGHIHTHPASETMQVSVISSGTLSQSSVYTIYGGAPSPGDHSEYRRSGNGGERFVAVDAKFIYLYNGNASQTIKLPLQ